MRSVHRAYWLGAAGVVAALLTGSLVGRSARQSTAAEPSSKASKNDSQAESARIFEDRIVPLLSRHCLECHGAESKKGRLNLSRKTTARAGGQSGEVIVPGKADESLLWQYVDSDTMPPEGRPRLSREEKQLLERWIDTGAVWSVDAIGAAAFTDERITPHHEFEPTSKVRDPGPILLRRLTVPEYIETVRSAVGVDIERDARRILPPDLRADGFRNTAYNQTIDLGNVEGYAELAAIIARRMDVAAFAARYAPSQELSDKNMRRLIAGMGKWLLRGPLGEHEVNAFLGIAHVIKEEGGDFTEAVRYVVEAMLQSPRFIYRIENVQGDGSVRRLGNYELASRLSYILWGAPPDKELMRAADAGELSDRDKVAAQVRRMLKDPRAVERSLRFIDEWLNLPQLSNLRPDPERFPGWSEQLAADMRAETRAFFEHVVWEQKRPLSELMNAQVTFATPRLARHYGLDRNLRAPRDVAESSRLAPRDEASSRGARRLPRDAQRITDGLRALYTFEEGNGKTIRDVSKAGKPLNLQITDPSAVRWSEQGLSVNRPTLIVGTAPARRLTDAVKKSKSITIEAWVTPANASQKGPARIVTLSSSIVARNFTLGQDGDKFDVRLRTTKTDANGIPSLSSPGGTVKTRPTHIVYTRARNGRARLYIDGKERAAREVGGDVSNWDGNFRLALANEHSKDRPWQGTFHLVAIYDRALSADDVRRNHAAGPPSGAASNEERLANRPVRELRIRELQALYRFDEGRGNTVRDVSEAGKPLDLKIENASAVEWAPGGLTVKAPALIVSAEPPRRLIEAVKKSHSITLEAWITPANTSQKGPARILTLSSGTGQRNFTLGQEGDKFDVRLRTTSTSGNGIPSLSSPGGKVQTRPTHVVYTRNPGGRVILYINGEEVAANDVGGNLSNWDGNFRLAIANETSRDRPWQGTLHRLAIYSRALSAEEIRSQIEGLSRYDLAAVPGRGGLLTQGSVLTVGGDDASMVTRGLFVLNDILCSGVDDPPPCVNTTPVPTKPGLSQRSIAMQRIANPQCGGCHVKFEPLAFGLEKFDGVGAYHETDEHGNKLRDDGEILFPGREEPVPYQSSAELMDLLAGSERVRQAITLKMTQFALGRPLVKTDAIFLKEIHEAAQKGGGTYPSLITAIVMSDLVQTTRTEDSQ